MKLLFLGLALAYARHDLLCQDYSDFVKSRDDYAEGWKSIKPGYSSDLQLR